MSATCCHSKSAGKFFSFLAHGSRKRFERKGFEASQEQLLNGLQEVGYQGATVLEVGCGVGHLHQSLLEKGAHTATGIDLAPKMLSEANDWAAERRLGDRVRYIEGDFMDVDEDLEKAEICLLDKVVCCYPDAHGLLHKSLEKTRRTYALTYPRNRWFVRVGTRLWNFLLLLMRSDFRTFTHDPIQIEKWIVGQGFLKQFEDQTAAWLTQVYVKP